MTATATGILKKQKFNNKSARESHFLVDLFAVTARLWSEIS